MAGGNLADCSAAVTTQTGDSAPVSNVTDDGTSTGSQQSKTGKVTVRVIVMMAQSVHTAKTVNLTESTQLALATSFVIS